MKRSLLASLLLIICAFSAFAQTTAGSLAGTISGPDGALPGATIVITDNTTGKEQTITANDSGAFKVAQLEAGTYTVKVTASGFKTFVANDLKIDVGREYNFEPKLEIGSVTENVTVTAGADVVTSTTAQVSNTVSPQQILSLPLLQRNPLTLTTLQAGTQSNPFQNTVINGVRTSFTNITRDGINIQDAFIRTNATDFAPGRPSVDDTAEFTIITSNQEADQGYGSAQIRLATPRGTQEFHGALFAYNRNSKFSANDFFANRAGRYVTTSPAVIAGTANVGDPINPRPFRNRNQFGGKIGGPMPVPGFGEGTPYFLKNKGFFFFNYEKIIDPIATLSTARTILTPSARNGVLTYNRTLAGTPIAANGVNCPSGAAGSICTLDVLAYARVLYPSLNVPTTIDPVIQSRILSNLPTAGNTFSVGDSSASQAFNTVGFQTNRKSDAERSTYTGRVDVDLTDKDTINGVYSYVFETNLRPDADTTTNSLIPEVSQTSKNKTLALAYRRIFSSNLVNEVRGGVFFSDVPFTRTSPIPNYFLSVQLITNPETTTFLNQGRGVKTYNFQDNADYLIGKHTLKFGGQIQDFKVNSYNFVGTSPTFLIQPVAGTTASFTAANFTSSAGGISTTQLATANGLLGLLGGFAVQGQQTYNLTDPSSGYQPGPLVSPFRYSNDALYVSDRWQISKNISITGGVRYELFTALKLANNLGLEPVIKDLDNPTTSLLDPAGTYNVLGTNSGEAGSYYKTDFNNFAPSVGIAWAPNFDKGLGKLLLGQSFVVRAGYSRAFGNDQLVTGLNNAITNNVGFAGRTGFAVDGLGNNVFNLRASGALPGFTAPAFVAPPFTYIRNNTTGVSGTNNFGTVFAVDPKLQTPSVDQYSFGIQREFFGNTALEIRYVGTSSKNLVRGVDLNQIDIFNNGFLADFNRAIYNTKLTGNPFCDRAYQLNVAGSPSTQVAANPACQAVTILTPSGTIALPNTANTATFGVGSGSAGRLLIGTNGISSATFISNLINAVPADAAFNFITLGPGGVTGTSVNNNPNLNNPNGVPFVKFLPNPSTGAVDYLLNDAKFFYNSVQVEIRRRFSSGLYFQANYTFSKNLTNAIGSLNGPNSGQSLFEPYLDNNNQSLDYSRADFDQTHAFNFNGVYQLPFGKGKRFLNNGGLMDKIVGGFEVSGILQMGSGAPITFVDTRGTLNRTARSTRQTPNSSLSNKELQKLVGIFERDGKIYFIDPSIIDPVNGTASNGYIEPGLNNNTAFNGQVFFNVPAGQTGNVGRFLINGPRTFNVNTALLKNINFTERLRLQIRGEAFNLFNNVNLYNNTQIANINSTTFGQITSSGTPRTIQLAARFEF